jgi:Arf-GAP/coiled-coil/ANK repeat/PH domain-containing protein
MQEFMKHIDQESRHSVNDIFSSPHEDSVRPAARSSQKVIEEVMQSAAKGKVVRKCSSPLTRLCL